jgi:5,10-methenyltetrahydromethanopterin hydrogenase
LSVSDHFEIKSSSGQCLTTQFADFIDSATYPNETACSLTVLLSVAVKRKAFAHNIPNDLIQPVCDMLSCRPQFQSYTAMTSELNPISLDSHPVFHQILS